MSTSSVTGRDEAPTRTSPLRSGTFEDWSKGGDPFALRVEPAPSSHASQVHSAVRDYYAPWQVMAIYEWLMTDPTSPLTQPSDEEMTRAARALGFPAKE